MLKKNHFIWLLTYSSVFIVLSAFVVLLLNYQVSKTVQRLCMDNYIFQLEEISEEMDRQIQMLDNRAVSIIINNNINAVVSAVSPKQGLDSVFPLYKFNQEMSSSVFIGDAFYYEYQIISRKNGLAYRNSSLVSDLEFFYNKMSNYPRMTYGQWYDSFFTARDKSFLPAQPVILEGRERNVITYLYPLAGDAKLTQSNAVIAFLIDTGDVAGILWADGLYSSSGICLMDKSGQMIYRSGGSGEEPGGFDIARMVNSGGYFEENNGEDLVAYTASRYNGMVYAVSVPKSVVLSHMYEVSGVVSAALAVYLIISAALAVIFAYKISKPIRALVAKLINAVPDSGLSDSRAVGELSFITENMLRLLEQISTLEKSTHNKSELLSGLVLDRLLSGQARPSDDSTGILNDMSFLKPWERCCAAVLRLPSIAANGPERFPIFRVSEAVEQMTGSDESFARYVHTTNDTVIAVIFVFAGENKEANQARLRACLAEADEYVYRASGIHPDIGQGRFFSDIYDIHFSYDQALQAAEALEGSGRAQPPYILAYNEIARNSETYFYPIDLEYRLINYVKSGDRQAIMSIFEKIIDENFTMRSLSPRMQRQLCYDLHSTVLKLCGETPPGDWSTEDAIAEIEKQKYASPDEILKSAFDCLLKIAMDAGLRKHSRNEEVKSRLLGYIKDRVSDPQMGVAMVADEFNFSESYFSQYFKLLTGEFFSAYLEKLRIDIAKSLLDENENISIEDLSRKVGYNNASTFRRAFKRVVGVSPSSYRRI